MLNPKKAVKSPKTIKAIQTDGIKTFDPLKNPFFLAESSVLGVHTCSKLVYRSVII